MKRDRIALLGGGVAAAVTLTVPLLPQNEVLGAILDILDIPLGFGMLFSMMLFHVSPHDAFPKWPVLILASIINAAIWIGLLRAWFWINDFVRALRS